MRVFLESASLHKLQTTELCFPIGALFPAMQIQGEASGGNSDCGFTQAQI